ncbi:MAG: carboxy terminal-processing peptidase [Desulfobacterium sp.]|nr:carboxy terminal-processing peptidase [Desulfobacterium sp.]
MKRLPIVSIAALLAAAIMVFVPPALATASGKNPAPPDQITFTSDDRTTCVAIINSLERNHYSGNRLNNAVSSRILDRYLTMLDPSKNLFTQEDIDRFEPLRYRLDNTLKKGDLTPGNDLFNLFIERSRERLDYIISLAKTWETDLDFTTTETIDLSREEIPWPANKKALELLWKKALKNTVLTLKLDKEPNDAITETLTKRYTSRLKRLAQTTSADGFRTYMNAVAMSFDPHTQYYPPRISEDFDIQMSLSLEGIGAVLQNEYEYTKVVRLITAGPAEKSNQLMPGDRIIGVGQDDLGEIQDVVGWRIDDVVKLIRGPKDTVVRLKIIPAEKKGDHNARLVSIKRDKVKLEDQAAKKTVETVHANGRDYTIGIIDIPAFYQDFKGSQAGATDYRSTTRDVRQLIEELKKENIDGLIIDLRNNGGGSLQEVNQLVGLFINSGPTVQIRGRNGFMSRLNDPDPSIVYTGPLVVMINRMSASASEIFAGAIKDYNRGIITGTRSFGKGTVQALQSIDKGQLKLTSAKFYRISGKSTQNLGVAPDISYPRLYNPEETGESSLKGALPWDMSRRAEFQPYKDLSPFIGTLRANHEKRTETSPDFLYLRSKYRLASDIYNLKQWSLNETMRKEQKERFTTMELEIENRSRQAKGLAPLEKMEENEDRTEEGKNDHDFLLKETEQVVVDFIDLAKTKELHW